MLRGATVTASSITILQAPLQAAKQPPPHQATIQVPLPGNSSTHFFIRFDLCGLFFPLLSLPHVSFLHCYCFSHSQSTGGDQANAIYLELERMGESFEQLLHTHMSFND